MSTKLEHLGKRVMNGDLTGPIGATLRGLLRCAEPFYAKAMNSRNAAYDTGKKPSENLGRPTISIGNITSGGTGKTPMVRWLCQQLMREKIRPAVLMRGYRATEAGGSDEQVMLEQFLGAGGTIIEANPDRVAGAAAVLAKAPDIGAFVLDDGFQHRRVRRNLDIVLISAIEPFGYGHVLPRGLLREPLAGLRRAGAVVITHARRVTSDQLEAIKTELRKVYPIGPIYHADHGPVGFRTQNVASSAGIDEYDDALRDEPVLACCGLGDPRVFQEQLLGLGARVLTTKWFGDHHPYSGADLQLIYERADAVGAKYIITTEKDWVKLRNLPLRPEGLPIWRLDVVMRFWWNDETMLLEQVLAGNQPKPAGG
ncbi:tetraacyldisaccharide 4'-kinase [soil metagenome]